MIEFNCLFCDKKKIRRDYKNKMKFCSLRCQADDRQKKYIEEWKRTGLSTRISGTPGWLKRYLLEKQEGKCIECKITDWNNKPIVLELEHKDGNSENNKEENLCLICPNCHSQTETYKAKNKGNGRHARRERYKEGKSF